MNHIPYSRLLLLKNVLRRLTTFYPIDKQTQPQPPRFPPMGAKQSPRWNAGDCFGLRPTQKLTLSLRTTEGVKQSPRSNAGECFGLRPTQKLPCHCERPKGVKQSPRSHVGDGFGLRPRHDRESFCPCRTALRCGVSRHDKGWWCRLFSLPCHCERPKGAKQSPRWNAGNSFAIRPYDNKRSKSHNLAKFIIQILPLRIRSLYQSNLFLS
jgi:hypothetical protein